MKPITINVSEPVYREFQDQAKRQDRTAAELIREAMEAYRERWRNRGGSLRDFAPVDLGEVIGPFTADDDLLDEML